MDPPHGNGHRSRLEEEPAPQTTPETFPIPDAQSVPLHQLADGKTYSPRPCCQLIPGWGWATDPASRPGHNATSTTPDLLAATPMKLDSESTAHQPTKTYPGDEIHSTSLAEATQVEGVSHGVEMLEGVPEATETKLQAPDQALTRQNGKTLQVSEAKQQAFVNETTEQAAQVETLGKQLAQRDQRIQELEAQRRALEESAAIANARLAEAETKLQECEAHTHTLGERHTDQMRATEASMQVLQEQLKGVETKFRDSEASLAMSREQQSSQVGALEGRLAEAETKYRDSDAERQVLEARLAEQVAVAESFSRKLPTVEDRLNETEIKLQESEAQRTVILMQNSQHLATIDDHSSAIKIVEGQLEEAKMKHEDLEAQRRALAEQCDEWSARHRALDASLQSSEAQRQILGTQYAEQLSATDAHRSEIEVLKGFLKEAETKSEAQQEDFFKQNSEHTARIGAMEETLAENERKLEEQMRAAEANIQVLQEQLKGTETKFRESEASLVISREQQSSQVEALEGRLADAEAKYRDSEAERQVFGARFAEQVAVAEGLSTKLPAVEDRLNETEVKLQESEAQRTALVLQNSLHLATIDDHSSVIKTVERQLEEVKMERQDLEAQQRALTQQCDEWSARHRALDASLQTSEAQRQTLGTQYAEQLSATDAYRSEIEELKGLLNGAETKLEAQRQDFVNSENTRAARIGELEETLAENERKLEELGVRHVEQVAVAENLSRRLPAVENRLSETEIKLQESEAQRAALVMQNSQHLATIDDHSGVIKIVEGQLEEAKMKHEEWEAQRRALAEQCDEWSARNRMLDASLVERDAGLQASEAQRQTLGTQYAEQLTLTDALRAEIEVLKEHLKGAETKLEAQQQDSVNLEHTRAARIRALEQSLAENERKLEELEAERVAAVSPLLRMRNQQIDPTIRPPRRRACPGAFQQSRIVSTRLRSNSKSPKHSGRPSSCRTPSISPL